VQDDAEEGTVNLEPAVVLDEAQFPEFVHEEVDARACRANHLRQDLLRQFGQHALGLVLLPISRQEQQRAGEALLAGVEELIDQVLFDADVSRQHVRDESVRERGLLVEHPEHLAFAFVLSWRS
jgi:hypothetical protein